MRHLGKVVYLKRYRRFESSSLRYDIIKIPGKARYFYMAYYAEESGAFGDSKSFVMFAKTFGLSQTTKVY
jgi:hypothetical protein